MRRSSRRNPKAAKPAAAATAPRRLRWRRRQRNSLNRAASRNDRVLRRIRSPGVACDLASSGAGVTPCQCAAHGSGESCFSVASLSPSFPLCLPLSPSISPKPMIATTSNRDCDEGRARLSRRKERRRAGREEGSEGAGGGEGGGRARRGAILPFPFGDKRSFMPPATEPLLRRGGGYTEVRRPSTSVGERQANELTAAFDRCRRRPR